LSYYWENCRNIGGASYGHDIRKFEKKVDAFANVVWNFICSILKWTSFFIIQGQITPKTFQLFNIAKIGYVLRAISLKVTL
jgi:hypothetical protein